MKKEDTGTPGRPSFIRNLEAGRAQTIVTYGTSLTAGGAWPSLLQGLLDRKYPGLATVINSGEGGQWSAWGIQNLEERVLRKNPDAVFIEFGINDAVLRFKATPEIARGNLEQMIERIQAQNPTCQVILLTLNCASGPAEERRGYQTSAYYEIYREVAGRRNLLLIDAYPAWKELLDHHPGQFQEWVPDLLHPGKEGTERVTMPVLEAALAGNNI